MKSLKFIINILILFIITYNSFSMIGVQVVVKGKVIDEITGEPVEAQIEFKTSTGSKFKIKSNSIDGSYSQVFPSGEKVEATFSNFDVIKSTKSFKVDDAEKFKEQELNFYVLKLVAGKSIYSFDGFSKNNDINPNAKETIQKLEEILTFCRGAKFDISVNSHDIYKKEIHKEEIKKTVKKGKKSTQEVEVKQSIKEPSQDEIKKLVDLRVKTIENIISNFKKFQNKINIVPDYSSGEPLEKTNNQKSHSIRVIVKEIKNQFE